MVTVRVNARRRPVALVWAVIAFVLAAGLLTGPPVRAADDEAFGRYYALVIGNNQYEHLPALKTAVNDASVVADLLRRDYGFEVELLLNATRDQLVDQLNRLRRELTPRRQSPDLLCRPRVPRRGHRHGFLASRRCRAR